MIVLNQQERMKRMGQAAGTLILTLSLAGIVLYFQFGLVPKAYSRETALTNDRIEELVRYTNDTDSLVIQIQRAPNVKTGALIPFYQWTNDLMATYKQPFYTAIIKSYSDLVDDIIRSKSADTILPALKQRMANLQKDNLALMQQQEALTAELKAARPKVP